MPWHEWALVAVLAVIVVFGFFSWLVHWIASGDS